MSSEPTHNNPHTKTIANTNTYTNTTDEESSYRVNISTIKFESGIGKKVLDHLDNYEPILLPNQSPLPYIIVARTPSIVNGVKGRPSEQAVCRLVSTFEEITPYLELNGPEAIAAARKYLLDEYYTVLLPIRREYFQPNVLMKKKKMRPGFVKRFFERRRKTQEEKQDASSVLKFKQSSSTIRDDALKMDMCLRESTAFNYCLFHATLALRNRENFCSQSRPLFGSSGNCSGQPYGQTLEEIVSQFKKVQPKDRDYHLLVLDAEHTRTHCSYHNSTSMIRVSPFGDVKTTRLGSHDYPEHKGTNMWRVTDGDEFKDYLTALDVYEGGDDADEDECDMPCAPDTCGFMPLSFLQALFSSRKDTIEHFDASTISSASLIPISEEEEEYE